MKKIVVMTCCLFFMGAHAAQAIDEIPSVIAIEGVPVAPQEETPAPHKAVRDMTPEERQAFWDDLPQEDKDRIIAKRLEIQAKKDRWKPAPDAPYKQ